MLFDSVAQGVCGVYQQLINHPRQQLKDGGASQEGQEQPQTEPNKEEAKAAEEKEDGKTQTLRAALSHVPKFGWTEAAIIAGARDVGLSPTFAGAFPGNSSFKGDYV